MRHVLIGCVMIGHTALFGFFGDFLLVVGGDANDHLGG